MATEFLALLLLLTLRPPDVVGTGAASDTTAAATAAHDTAGADSAAIARRVVRQFPPVVVIAPLHDLRSSETVRMVPGATLGQMPVDGTTEALALQPGVVAQGEELHVRGGRAGETTTYLDGMCLSEPQWHRPLTLPLLAVASADLVSGAPEAPYGSGLAGVVDLRSVDPGVRISAPWRWQSALGSRWYDRWSAGVATPLRVLGLGVVAAADATFDDSWLPSLRSESTTSVAGLAFRWRAENRVLGFFKLAPVDRPQRFAAEVLVSRHLQRPYDRMWTTDGWVSFPDPKGAPVYSPTPVPGSLPYQAADHLDVTDERQVAAQVSVSRLRSAGRMSLALSWLRTRTVTSVSGTRGIPRWPGVVFAANEYDVLWGDDPLYRESGSDAVTLHAGIERTYAPGTGVKVGAGATYEHASLYELDGTLIGSPLDWVRHYDASAPGAFAYVQGRWQAAGLVMNTGLRAEYWTAGPQGHDQTLPWDGKGALSLSPRLGFAYPVSVRDAFSLAYQRSHQAPGRDYLYDRRLAISCRQPLGNPALRPATMTSYEAALKHLFGPRWAAQVSLFYRDVFGEVGLRNLAPEGLPITPAYTSDDYASASGFELSVIRVARTKGRLEFGYTFLHAWGQESQPEGDPFGTLRGFRTIPRQETSLSWDRHHTFQFSGLWQVRTGLALSWSETVASPLPWTPKPRRDQLQDMSQLNSRELDWTESANAEIRWAPGFAHGIEIGMAVRNLFDSRGEIAATVDGYPSPYVNTVYDDYAAYRTETGQGGGAYWVEPSNGNAGYWVPVHDPRLYSPPRAVRVSLGARW